MRRFTILLCLMLLALPLSRKVYAQDAPGPESPKTRDAVKPATPPVHYYRLDFVIEELGGDGKPVNSRGYSTSVGTVDGSLVDRNTTSIRTGSKIPIVTAMTENSGKEGQQFQYIDVGVNIDIRDTHEVGNKLALNLGTELTALAQSADPSTHQPIIRQNRWQAPVLIPIGKPSVAFTSDSLDNKGSTRVLVTATLVQ